MYESYYSGQGKLGDVRCGATEFRIMGNFHLRFYLSRYRPAKIMICITNEMWHNLIPVR